MQAYLERLLPHACQRPLLALAPGARWPTKRWPVERFAAVAEALALAQGAGVVILGGAEDAALAAALCQRLSVPVLDSTGQLSLMHTAALLQRCRLLLSNDSGLMHLATALQVPVVAIFGPTVQEFGFYPFHATSTGHQHPLGMPTLQKKRLGLRCPRGASSLYAACDCVRGAVRSATLVGRARGPGMIKLLFEVGHLYHRAVFDPLYQVLHQDPRYEIAFVCS